MSVVKIELIICRRDKKKASLPQKEYSAIWYDCKLFSSSSILPTKLSLLETLISVGLSIFLIHTVISKLAIRG